MPDLRLGIDARDARSGAEEFRRAGKTVIHTSSGMEKGFTSAEAKLKGFLLGLASLAAAKAGLTTLSEYEKRLVAVGKTADVDGERLEALGQKTLQLAQRLPIGITRLLELEEAAGTLGVRGSSNLLAFAETLGKLESATDVVGATGAKSIARILTVTGDGVEGVRRFGSVLTQLGNNAAASEQEILDTANEVAKSTAVYRVNSTQVLGLAAAYKSLGVDSAVAGTSTSKAFFLIDQAARNGGQQLQTIASIARVSGEEFQKIYAQDSLRAFQLFIRGVGEIDAAGGSAAATLTELGLADERVLKTLLPLATRYEVFSDTLALASAEAEKQTSLNEESAKSTNTLSGQWKLLKNTLSGTLIAQLDVNQGLASAARFTRQVIQVLTGQEDAQEEVSSSARITARSIKFLAAEAALLAGVKVGTALSTWITGLVATTVRLRSAAQVFGLWNVISLRASPLLAKVTTGFNALWAVISRNPLVSIAVGLGTVAAALIAFGDESERAERKYRSLKDLQEDSGDVLSQLANQQARYNRALRANDNAEAAAAIRGRIDLLKEESIRLQELVDKGQLGRVDPNVVSSFIPSFATRAEKILKENKDLEQRLTAQASARGEFDSIASALATRARIQKTLEASQGVAGGLFIGLLEGEVNKLTEALERLEDADGFSSLGENATGGIKVVSDELASLERELELVRQNAGKLERDIDRAVANGVDPERARQILTEINRLEGTRAIENVAKNLTREVELLKLSGEERAIAEEQALAVAEADKFGLKVSEDILKSIKESAVEKLKLRDISQQTAEDQRRSDAELRKELNRQQNLFNSVEFSARNAIVAPLEDAVFEATTLEEAISNIGRALARLTVRKALLEPIASGLAAPIAQGISALTFGSTAQSTSNSNVLPADQSFANGLQANAQTTGVKVSGGPSSEQLTGQAGLGLLAALNPFTALGFLAFNAFGARQNARGNVFSGGRLHPHAKGDIFGGPTYFNGPEGTDVLGEGGIEGAFPITRTSKGELAVKAEGGTSGRQFVFAKGAIQINGVSDVGSFRRSERSILNTFKKLGA
jgi:phage tail tape measure protein, TP901 family, core region